MRVRIETLLVLVSTAMILFALWVIGDVWRGKAGPEDLVPMVTLLIASVVIVVSLIRRLFRRGSVAHVSPTPVLAAAHRMRSIEKWVMATVTLIVVLFTAAWIARSGDVVTPILLGGLMLIVAWIIARIVLRILRFQTNG